MSDELRHVTIIGVGLLGGSLGLAIKRRYPGAQVAGVGRREASLREALEAGAIDRAHLEPGEAVGQSDLVILATPVGAFQKHLLAIRDRLKPGAIVTDVGSTKAAVVRMAANALGEDGPFVGSHPMAGSELKGANHARADLFEGALCVLTPTPQTPPALVRRVEAFWRDIGMKTVRMDAAAHDKAVAVVSHLPHALAALLMGLPSEDDLKLAAGGFRDMTRLAGGDSEMWRDILMTNRKNLLAAIDRLDEQLMRLRDLLEVGDAPAIQTLLAEAQKRREQCNHNSKPH